MENNILTNDFTKICRKLSIVLIVQIMPKITVIPKLVLQLKCSEVIEI